MGSFHGFLDIDGVASALLLDPLFYGIRGTLADAAAFDVHAIAADETVDAADADGAEQAADGGRDEAY